MTPERLTRSVRASHNVEQVPRRALVTLLLPGLSLFSAFALAQPAAIPQASDIDWVAWDQLSDAQRAAIDPGCCGAYIEPALPDPGTDTGGTLIRGHGLAGGDAGIWTVTSGIEVIQPEAYVTAARGTYDQNLRMITLEGDIRIRQPGMLLTGQRATVDEVSADSDIIDASYLLHEDAIRGSADNIRYDDADGVITIDNGAFTRCEPGDDSWLIRGEEIVLNRQSGRGVARNVTLRVNDVPLLYLPRISFPISDARQTGFLAPVLGSTRDGGFDIATPYYLNLAPNYDATLTPRIQTERGVMLGVEGRYLGRRHEQQLNMQYLPGDNLYDPDTLDQPDTDSPPTADRWLLDYGMRGNLAPGWSARVDYAAVSDIDYFQDLGNNGLVSTSQSFLRRNARLNYRDENWRFQARAQDFQLIDPTVTARAEPYRLLPAMRLRGDFHQDWGLEYGVDVEYANFDRDLDPDDFSQAQIDAGALVTGSRYHLRPEVSLPWSNSYAFVTPSLWYQYTGWHLEDNAEGTAATPTRGIFSTSVDAGLIFERDLDLLGHGLRQTLEPRLFYLYNEFEEQQDLPLFDSTPLTFSYSQLFRDDRFSGNDRVGDANQVTLAVSTRFLDADGAERARASVGQIHHFRDRRVTLGTAPDVAEQSTSHLVGEFSVTLGENWRAGSYLEWNSNADRWEVGNFQFQYQSAINRILNVGYRYREVPGPAEVNGVTRRIDQIDISGIWPLSDQWGLFGRYNHDLANSRNLETIAGFEYSNCCWTMRVLARQWIDNDALFHGIDDDNAGFFIQFELKGLGSVLGGNVSGILNNGISGYRQRE